MDQSAILLIIAAIISAIVGYFVFEAITDFTYQRELETLNNKSLIALLRTQHQKINSLVIRSALTHRQCEIILGLVDSRPLQNPHDCGSLFEKIEEHVRAIMENGNTHPPGYVEQPEIIHKEN